MIEVTRDTNCSGIYMILNEKNKKIYIGSSRNVARRKYEHMRLLKNGTHHNKYMQRAYNIDSKFFKFFLLEEIPQLDNLLKREQYWIDKYESYDNSIGYNLSPTAGNTMGYKFSDESKQKIRETKLGKRNAMYGKTRDDDFKKKVSRKVVQMKDNEVIKIWNSASEASRELGIDRTGISRCCNGIFLESGGFNWKFI